MAEFPYIPRVPSNIVLLAALLLPLTPLACAGGLNARYDRACRLMDAAASPRTREDAGKYREALGILMRIREEHPFWEAHNVERRIEECRRQIDSAPSAGKEGAGAGEMLAYARQLEAEEVEIRERAGRAGPPGGDSAEESLSPPVKITFGRMRAGRSRNYSREAVKRYESAEAMVLRNDYNGAIGELREAIYLEGDYVEAFIALGEIYETVGEDGIAMEAYRSSLSIDDGAAEAHCGIGNILIREGMKLERESKLMEAWAKYQNAVMEYKRATWIDITCAPAYYGIGVAYSRLGRHSDAAYYWKKTIETAGEDSEHGRRAKNNLAITGLAP